MDMSFHLALTVPAPLILTLTTPNIIFCILHVSPNFQRHQLEPHHKFDLDAKDSESIESRSLIDTLDTQLSSLAHH
jgi:hypothetical protein